MGRRPKQTFLQRHTDHQQKYEKMLNLTNYQRNAKLKQNEVPPHTSHNGHHQSLQIINVGEGMGKTGTFLHCSWECKLVQPLWKRVCRLLRKLKIELPHNLAIPLLGIYPEKKTIIQKDTSTSMFIEVIFTVAKIWNQPKCPFPDKWIKKMWHIYTMEYSSAIKRKKSCHLQQHGCSYRLSY